MEIVLPKNMFFIIHVHVHVCLFVCSDAVHGVTCAILLLNSDLHTDVSTNIICCSVIDTLIA